MNRLYYPLCCAAALTLSAFAGCGLMVDPDRNIVAKVDDEVIRLGDLFDIIYDMQDAERPVIRTRFDLRRVLEQIVDERIKKPLGKRLVEEGKISVPREYAREAYFLQSGDQEEDLRTMWNMDLSAGEAVESALAAYGMTVQAVQIQKDFIEQETDLMLERMQADQAVQYMAAQEYQAGRLQVEERDLRMEYEVQKADLLQFEQLEFVAVRLPTTVAGARDEAALVRKRIDEGEKFDDVFNEYANKGDQFVMQSTIENNPAIERFRSFWAQLSGAQPGEVHGPVYLPESQIYKEGPGGEQQAQVVPAHWLILQVINQTPERTLTLEEATPRLLPPLLVARMMEKLREDHGVEVFEENLPDPAEFKDEYGDSILDL